MPAAFPGNINTFIPSFEASGRLQIEFSRNPESFALNRYVGIKSVTKGEGRYLQITAEEASRVVDEADYTWNDGQDAPSGKDGTESHIFNSYRTERFAYAFRLGDKSVEQADWDILASHARISAQKAMTARTKMALAVLEAIASWGANTDTSTNLGGGRWDSSSATNQYILKSFNAVKEAIHIATQGAVPPEALRCVINPTAAHKLRESIEIIDYIKQNPTALGTLRGDEFFERWGVPPLLYGVRMVVEDAVLGTTRKKITAGTKTYAMDSDKAFFTAVTEGLENSREPAEGAPTFNTMTLFVLEDMTVESKRDDDNRRTNARVVDDFEAVLTAPPSGYLVQDILT